MKIQLDFHLKEKQVYKYKMKCSLFWLEPKDDIIRIILNSINFRRIILLKLEKPTRRFVCGVCDKSFLNGIAIVTEKQWCKMNLTKWLWFCHECIRRDEIRILVGKLYRMSDMFFEIFTSSVNFLLKEVVK